MKYAASPGTNEGGSPSRKRLGRPKGIKNKPAREEKILRELIETKLTLAEMALDRLTEKLRQTTDEDEREKLLAVIDEIIEKIKRDS